jgi:hypothetical protein
LMLIAIGPPCDREDGIPFHPRRSIPDCGNLLCAEAGAGLDTIRIVPYVFSHLAGLGSARQVPAIVAISSVL